MAVNLIATEIVNKRRKYNSLCGLCGVPVSREDSGLCKPCVADLPKNDRACPGCAVPMPASLLCPECLQYPNHDITSIFTLYRYEYPINRLIQDMKYQARMDIACSMGNQLGLAALGQGLRLPDCIIPVPLHRSRVAERGYNQSLEIARPLANMLGIPIDLKTCKRNRRTLPQTGLPVQQRRHNIRGAFTITRTPNYGHVAIIDDVVTTRATVNELSRNLMRAGVSRIDVWACARAFC